MDKDYNIYRLIRMANNMTVYETALQLGVNPEFVQSIEAGTIRPSDDTIKKYSEIMGISEGAFKYLDPAVIESKGRFSSERLLLKLLRLIIRVEDKRI